MMWPKSENERIPEGHYSFRLNREPELKAFSSTDREGRPKEGRRIILYVRGIGDQGEFSHVESFVPWEERYAQLCKALHVDHGRDIEMEGAMFEADIKHEPDPNNPLKSYARIVNIVVPAEGDGDDVPF